MLIMGVIVLMPGVGFILSAAITWEMAGRLGMIPGKRATVNESDGTSNLRDGQ
jgi:hypothetical protein